MYVFFADTIIITDTTRLTEMMMGSRRWDEQEWDEDDEMPMFLLVHILLLK